jgi:hypothetical protein
MRCPGTLITRRRFLHSVAAWSGAAIVSRGPARAAQSSEEVPIRAITRGPKFHWFGYYDKLQFNPASRLALAHEISFEHRSPTAADVVKVGMIGLRDHDCWIELGESRAWNWQQGCMLQWLPGSDSQVIWNDREGDRFICHVLDVNTGKRRTLPHPIYALSPDGAWAIAPDFRRLNDCRPGYGYAGIADPNREVAAPEDAGIWRLDLRTGKTALLLSFAQLAKVPQPGGFSADAKHWFNHLLVAPDGKRFTFLHRWRGAAEGKSWKTRMFTANADGSRLHLLIAGGRVSHFVWRDPNHILAYAGYGAEARIWRFQVFEYCTNRSEVVEGMLETDGHCTYLAGNRWVLCDTYPDKDRDQNLYLLELAARQRSPLGRFSSPARYTGEWRCDLHPRSSPDGKLVAIQAQSDDFSMRASYRRLSQAKELGGVRPVINSHAELALKVNAENDYCRS